MKRILITGATGNIGRAVIHSLLEKGSTGEIIAGVRDISKAQKVFQQLDSLKFCRFDFEQPDTFDKAFEGVDILFLLRPPHISNVKHYFEPLLASASKNKIRKISFLSVQGAEKSSVIPHHKIEKLILSKGFQYQFIRPSYFMQNLTTTLLPEIKKHKRITLPSGSGRFNWIDVEDIGKATAKLIAAFEAHKNKAYEITGSENLNFHEVTQLMTDILDQPIQFNAVNPISFYFKKKREGIIPGMALVMTILHFLPRVQDEPQISDQFKEITGQSPVKLGAFLEKEKMHFQ